MAIPFDYCKIGCGCCYFSCLFDCLNCGFVGFPYSCLYFHGGLDMMSI